MAERACCHCGDTAAELRPYGPNGAYVCFECAMNPEHRAETDRQFGGRLALIQGPVVLTSEGPAPAEQFIRDLAALLAGRE